MGRLLDFLNGLARVEALWADLGTVHDGVTSIQLVGIIQLLDALLCEVITAVHNPPASQKGFESQAHNLQALSG